MDPLAQFRLECDLGRHEELDRPVAEALSAYGRVDVLVNNAGLSDPGSALEEPLERFTGVLDVNLTAPFVLAQHAARDMLARGEGGSIVNVASMLLAADASSYVTGQVLTVDGGWTAV